MGKRNLTQQKESDIETKKNMTKRFLREYKEKFEKE